MKKLFGLASIGFGILLIAMAWEQPVITGGFLLIAGGIFSLGGINLVSG